MVPFYFCLNSSGTSLKVCKIFACGVRNIAKVGVACVLLVLVALWVGLEWPDWVSLVEISSPGMVMLDTACLISAAMKALCQWSLCFQVRRTTHIPTSLCLRGKREWQTNARLSYTSVRRLMFIQMSDIHATINYENLFVG